MTRDATDGELLNAHRHGDPDALAVLMHRHRPRMLAVARQWSPSHADAEDAVQDSVLRALRHLHGFRGESSLATWLHRITVHTCIDRERRRRRESTDPTGPDDLAAALAQTHAADPDPTTRCDARLLLVPALQSLPEEQRTALVLVDITGLTVQEAATRLGCAVGTVKSRRARGRQALAARLTDRRAG